MASTNEHVADEPSPRRPLLTELDADEAALRPPDDFDIEEDGDAHAVQQIVRKLCVSHALTTWNARSYEFAAVCLQSRARPHSPR